LFRTLAEFRLGLDGAPCPNRAEVVRAQRAFVARTRVRQALGIASDRVLARHRRATTMRS
jgi:hypothetical protein